MMTVRRALISLTDKRNAAEFGKVLARLGVEILSTGNTARVLRDAGVPVVDVAQYTGFPEMLDGRVKTLHAKIFAGLLARRDLPAHLEALEQHALPPIDLVAVNLYPFEQVSADPGVALDHAIENIDIGGPSLIRAAAKNHEHVAVVVDPDDYAAIAAELEASKGSLAQATLRRLARKAFERTAAYDAAIAAFLGRRTEFGGEEGIDPSFLRLSKRIDLRYGENPHQRAAFFPLANAREPSVSTARQLNGKELSYNNILDCDAAFQLACEFERPAAVVVKHTNPCGAAVSDSVIDAFERAYAGDAVSAFGGILAFNREVGVELAERIAQPNRFVECIIAPAFQPAAVTLLCTRPKWGKNVRLLETGFGSRDVAELDVRKVRGGLLIQDPDRKGADDEFTVVTRKAPDDATMRSLRFAWLAVKHVKSNAILLAKDEAIVGVGAGQMSRVDSVQIAVRKSAERATGAVLASDAFFPFRDGLDEAAKAGVIAIVQPGGSVKDPEVVAAADEHGLAMVFTGVRHFRH